MDNLIWATILATGVVVGLAPLFSDFRIEWTAFIVPAGVGVMLLAGAWFYRHLRRDIRLADALECTAQVTLFAAVGAPLSYLAASANLPLWDHALDAIDQGMAFDWESLLDALNHYPVIYNILSLIYGSLTLQMTSVVLCLGFTGRLAWLRVYNLAFIIAVLAAIAISVALPAAGVWLHRGLSISETQHLMPGVSASWPVFHGLRDGSFRSLVAVGSQGIITFPSVHAALGVIVLIGLWPLPRIRWIAVGLSAGTLLSTPIEGSHYLIDVVAGILLAVASFGAALGISRRIEAARAFETEPVPSAATSAQH